MIKFDNITVKFRGATLLSRLNLEIKENSKTLITGKSGKGKSTLFSILLGFYDEHEGKVFFDGEEITDENIWDVRKQIAYVPQDTNFADGKVSEWFEYIASIKANHNADFSETRIKEIFGFFDLPQEIFTEAIENLSGGEKQRLVLATAILLNRKVFLLDEPTSALDAKLKQKVVDYFSSLENKTTVIISHDTIWQTAKNFNIYDLEKQQWVR